MSVCLFVVSVENISILLHSLQCKVFSKNRPGLTLNCHHSYWRQSSLPKDEKFHGPGYNSESGEWGQTQYHSLVGWAVVLGLSSNGRGVFLLWSWGLLFSG